MEDTFTLAATASAASEASQLMGQAVDRMAAIYEQRESALRRYQFGNGARQHSTVDANDRVRVAFELFDEVLDYGVVIDNWLKNQAYVLDLFMSESNDAPAGTTAGSESAEDLALRIANDAFETANANWAERLTILRRLASFLGELTEQFNYRQSRENSERIKSMLEQIAPLTLA